MKTPDWDFKAKYTELVSQLAGFAEHVEMEKRKKKPITKRDLIQSRRIYVNFEYDICDSKDYADDHWGKGNYDVYALNKELSPIDEESDRYFEKRAQSNAAV